MNNNQWKALRDWVCSEIKKCGVLSIQEGIEYKMENMLSRTAAACRTISSKKEAMQLVDKLWQAFGVYMYITSKPPNIKDIAN